MTRRNLSRFVACIPKIVSLQIGSKNDGLNGHVLLGDWPVQSMYTVYKSLLKCKYIYMIIMRINSLVRAETVAYLQTQLWHSLWIAKSIERGLLARLLPEKYAKIEEWSWAMRSVKLQKYACTNVAGRFSKCTARFSAITCKFAIACNLAEEKLSLAHSAK